MNALADEILIGLEIGHQYAQQIVEIACQQMALENLADGAD